MKEINVETKKRKAPKSLIESISNVNRNEARHLVDNYYQTQEHRIALFAQLRSVNQGVDGEGKPNEAIEWLANDMKCQEDQIKTMLDWYTDQSRIGKWCKSVMGIGPVLTAGLISAFDVTNINSAGNFWSYAGLNDNNKEWLGSERADKIVKEYFSNKELTEENIRVLARIYHYNEDKFLTGALSGNKKETYSLISIKKYMAKPPYNTDLKVLCWKVGQQFIKLANNEKSLYGRIYKERKAYETAKNENGDYAEEAAKKIANTKKWNNKEQEAIYLSGKLPDSHITARASRYAQKLFVSHLFEAMYYYQNGVKAPEPYVFAVMGHKDYIAPEISYESII